MASSQNKTTPSAGTPAATLPDVSQRALAKTATGGTLLADALLSRASPANYVFFDLETSRHPRDKEIWELALVELDRRTLREVSEYHTLIRTEHWTEETRDPKLPSFADVQQAIFDKMDGRVWCGHNVKSFDNAVLRKQYEREGLIAPEPLAVFDTLSAVRRVWPKELTEGNHKLASFNAYFGLESQTHRALQDVRDNIECIKNVALLSFMASQPDLSRILVPVAPTDGSPKEPRDRVNEPDPGVASDRLAYRVADQSREQKVELLTRAIRDKAIVVFHYRNKSRGTTMEQRGRVSCWQDAGRKFMFDMKHPKAVNGSRLVDSIDGDVKFFTSELLRGPEAKSEPLDDEEEDDETPPPLELDPEEEESVKGMHIDTRSVRSFLLRLLVAFTVIVPIALLCSVLESAIGNDFDRRAARGGFMFVPEKTDVDG